jgi:hypothetical protein
MLTCLRRNDVLARACFCTTRQITMEEIARGEDEGDRHATRIDADLTKQQSIVSLVLAVGVPVVAVCGLLLGNLLFGFAIALILAAQCLRFNSKITAHRLSRGMRSSAARKLASGQPVPEQGLRNLDAAFSRYVLATVFGLPIALLLQGITMFLQLIPTRATLAMSALVIPVSMVTFAISVIAILWQGAKMRRAVSEVFGETS